MAYIHVYGERFEVIGKQAGEVDDEILRALQNGPAATFPGAWKRSGEDANKQGTLHVGRGIAIFTADTGNPPLGGFA